MPAQSSPNSAAVSEYWHKRHTVEKMIHELCSLEVSKDYDILHPEKRKRDHYTGLIITFKGNNGVINKTRVETIFNSSDVKPSQLYGQKSFILDLRNIPASKDHVLVPAVLPETPKTDMGIMLKINEVLGTIIQLHSLRKIIGVSENSKPTGMQMVFNYFNNLETKLAMDFFGSLGFSFERPNNSENKLIFILELPEDISYEKDENTKPIERKFSFSNEEILKLVEWECNHRLCSKLKNTGRVNGDKELSTRFVPNASVKIECVKEALKFLKETYQIESIQDNAEPKTFFIKLKQNQTTKPTNKMPGKKTKNSLSATVAIVAEEIGISTSSVKSEKAGYQFPSKNGSLRIVKAGSPEVLENWLQKFIEGFSNHKVKAKISSSGKSIEFPTTKRAASGDSSPKLQSILKEFEGKISHLISDKSEPVDEKGVISQIAKHYFFLPKKSDAVKFVKNELATERAVLIKIHKG